MSHDTTWTSDDTRAGRLQTAACRRVPRCATLEGFAAHVASTRGVAPSNLVPLTRLHVRTRNTTYCLIILEPRARMMIQGGHFFSELTEGHFQGSTLGGSLLKVDWIGVGLSMEFSHAGRRIVTSPVRSWDVEPTTTDIRPS